MPEVCFPGVLSRHTLPFTEDAVEPGDQAGVDFRSSGGYPEPRSRKTHPPRERI